MYNVQYRRSKGRLTCKADLTMQRVQKTRQRQKRGSHLHGGHVVEGVIQLLADGFVLEFLGIQLV